MPSQPGLLEETRAKTVSDAVQHIRDIVDALFVHVDELSSAPDNDASERDLDANPLALLPCWRAPSSARRREYGISFFNVLSCSGSELPKHWRQCKTEIAFINRALASHQKRLNINAKTAVRLNSMFIDRSKLWNRVNDTKQDFQLCVKALEAQRRIDVARRDGHSELEMLVLEVKEVCDSLQLSCDIDIVQQSSKQSPTKALTIMIGSNGELACFAIEISASSTSTSAFTSAAASVCTSCVRSVQATFVFGEEELCNEGIDADVLEILQNRDYDSLRESLRSALALEQLIEASKVPVDMRQRVSASLQALHLRVDERLSGPRACVFKAPVDLLRPLHPLSHAAVHLVFKHCLPEPPHEFVFVVRPALVLCVSTALALSGASDSSASFSSASFSSVSELLLLPSSPVRIEAFGSVFDASAALDASEARAVSVSHLTFAKLDDLGPAIGLLRQNLIFNRLLCSFLEPTAGADLKDVEARSVEITGECPRRLVLRTSRHRAFWGVEVHIGIGGDLDVRVSGAEEQETAAFASAVLRKSLSLPVMLHYVLMRLSP